VYKCAVPSVSVFITCSSVHTTPSAYSGERESKGKECKRCKCKLDGSKFGVYKGIDPRCDEGNGIKAFTRVVKEEKLEIV